MTLQMNYQEKYEQGIEQEKIDSAMRMIEDGDLPSLWNRCLSWKRNCNQYNVCCLSPLNYHCLYFVFEIFRSFMVIEII